MGVLDIFSGGKPAREDEIDIDEFLGKASYVSEDETRTWVEVMKLNTKDDVNNIISKIEKNSIVIIDISPMLKDKAGVKKAVDDLKSACLSIDGDIGRVSANQIIVVPGGMRVRKG